MPRGKLFDPTIKSMFWVMLRSEILQWKLNKTPLWNVPKRNWLLKRLLGSIDGNPYMIISPFHVQQGNNTHIGKNFLANYNCVILDHEEVHIGDNVLIAPNVSILTVSHPLLAEERIVRVMEDSFEPGKRGNWEVDAPRHHRQQCVDCGGEHHLPRCHHWR